ncbi:MAG: MnhB domain-containing protein [Candidatus Cyclobacteriaceae bacterium M3_2C_046]
MRTLILSTIIKILIPLFTVFAIYMFFRGHNNPGGGFIAGLIISVPFMLYSIAFGYKITMRIFRIKPMFLVGCGLLLSSGSGLFSMVNGLPYLSGVWLEKELPIIGKLGTPIIFDLGVLILVSGVVLKITFLLSEE